MKRILALFLAGTLSAAAMSPSETVPPFFPGDSDNSKWELSQYTSWEKGEDGSPVLKVNIPSGSEIVNTTYGGYRTLDLSAYRGRQIVLSAEIEVDQVPARKETFRSAKIMVCHRTSEGVRYISSSFALWGSQSWKKQFLTMFVPFTESKNTLLVGLQYNTGIVRIRNLRLEEKDLFPVPFKIPENFRCEYTENIKNTPRLRGAGCISGSDGIPCTNEKDARDFAALGGNVFRWWLFYDALNPDLRVMERSLERTLEKLEKLLPLYEKLGIRVIPVLGALPGGRYSNPLKLGITDAQQSEKEHGALNFRLYFDQKLLDAYVRIWRKIARRLKQYPAVYGYSVMNEPTQIGEVPYNYLYCQYLAAKAIREEDPERMIYIAANDWDSAHAFSYLKPLPLKNIGYEVHMYIPYEYTHQGVGDSIARIKEGKFFSYPGKIGDSVYNRDVLKKQLDAVARFQKKYGARIYCGEFSVIRWAPGGAQYLDDLCSIFEELGWDWAYHCYREWLNWSLEYPSAYPAPDPAEKPTDRMKVIQRYFQKNRSDSRK